MPCRCRRIVGIPRCWPRCHVPPAYRKIAAMAPVPRKNSNCSGARANADFSRVINIESLLTCLLRLLAPYYIIRDKLNNSLLLVFGDWLLVLFIILSINYLFSCCCFVAPGFVGGNEDREPFQAGTIAEFVKQDNLLYASSKSRRRQSGGWVPGRCKDSLRAARRAAWRCLLRTPVRQELFIFYWRVPRRGAPARR